MWKIKEVGKSDAYYRDWINKNPDYQLEREIISANDISIDESGWMAGTINFKPNKTRVYDYFIFLEVKIEEV